MKVKDLRTKLKQLGCYPSRMRGSHEIWSSPSGQTLPPVVANHMGQDASYGVLTKIAKALRREGIELLH